jgi:hypothetical protein
MLWSMDECCQSGDWYECCDVAMLRCVCATVLTVVPCRLVGWLSAGGCRAPSNMIILHQRVLFEFRRVWRHYLGVVHTYLVSVPLCWLDVLLATTSNKSARLLLGIGGMLRRQYAACHYK